jgi:hypothetical protein
MSGSPGFTSSGSGEHGWHKHDVGIDNDTTTYLKGVSPCTLGQTILACLEIRSLSWQHSQCLTNCPNCEADGCVYELHVPSHPNESILFGIQSR